MFLHVIIIVFWKYREWLYSEVIQVKVLQREVPCLQLFLKTMNEFLKSKGENEAESIHCTLFSTFRTLEIFQKMGWGEVSYLGSDVSP